MSNVPFLLVAILFAAKILENLTVPYVLATRPRGPEGKPRRIAIMPGIEFVLLIAMLGLALGGLSPWPFRSVALTGAGIIAFSYVHLVVAGILAGWIASIISKRNERHDATQQPQPRPGDERDIAPDGADEGGPRQ